MANAVVFVLLGIGLQTGLGHVSLVRAQDVPAADSAATDSARIAAQAESLKARADSLLSALNDPDAIQAYETALEVNGTLDRPRFVIRTSYNLSRAYDDAGDPEKALSTLRPILATARELEWDAALARILSTTASMHRKLGAYDRAMTLYDEALAVNRRLERPVGTAVNSLNKGTIYYRQGRFKQALRSYEVAIEAGQAAERPDLVTNGFNNIGVLYRSMGQPTAAMRTYRRALAYNRTYDLKEGVAALYSNIGTLLLEAGQTEDALVAMQEAFRLHQELELRYETALSRLEIGNVYQRLGRYDEARRNYEAGLRSMRDINRAEGIVDALYYLGGLDAEQERFDAALDRYAQALAISRRLGGRPGEARILRSVGLVHLTRGAVDDAIASLSDAVTILEDLRRNTISPDARRSYLAVQIDVYQALTDAYVQAGQDAKALSIAEQGRARLLAEKLIPGSEADAVAPVDALQNSLASGTAAVVYANVDSDRAPLAFVVTRERVRTVRLPTRRPDVRDVPELDSLFTQYAKAMDVGRMLPAPQGSLAPRRDDRLTDVIRLFREALVLPESRLQATRPDQLARLRARRDTLGRALYDVLVDPLRDALDGTDTWVVVPDGALGFLPFEALRTPEGPYLVESRDVRYAQSLNVLYRLQQRPKEAYARSLLAVGGVSYDAANASVQRVRGGSVGTSATADAALDSISSAALTLTDSLVLASLPTLRSVRQDQTSSWGQLPGTDTEVRLLERAVPNTDVLTRGAASETRIRRMHATGQLLKYRWIHFATHGFVDPSTPDASALVLAPGDTTDAASDGYLTMREIADLDLSAEVVTLSACQTGMGRLYRGEGVVSLAHAVFEAGARGTTVSLWNVVDGSTGRFMNRVYRNARLPNTSFAEAVTQAKRTFLRDENAPPLIWAPFVYYGP